MSEWQPIANAPRDQNILVWFDHDADPYHSPADPCRLTDYAALTEGGPFMDGKGHCIAKWQETLWEATDEYGGGYWLPAYWFAFQHGDYECVVHPTHWMPLPLPPTNSTPTKEN